VYWQGQQALFQAGMTGALFWFNSARMSFEGTAALLPRAEPQAGS